MGSQKRRTYPSIKESLFQEFYSFSFFKAVSLLESLYHEKKPLGETLVPEKEAVRFSVKPDFKFPPSDILEIKHQDKQGPVDMKVTFMGLTGPAGILPDWLTELSINRERKKDRGINAFYDIFHHRLISLFYLAWKKYQFPENYLPDAQDSLSKYLLSLIGLGTGGLSGRIGLSPECLIFCSGLLSRQSPSVAAIESAVEYLADTRVQVDQFIERLLPLETEDQTQIGLLNSRLGIDTIVGKFVWENQSKFMISLGPMDYKKFLRFLPTGDLLGPIFSLVRYMVGIEFEFDIRLVLKREEPHPVSWALKLRAVPAWVGQHG